MQSATPIANSKYNVNVTDIDTTYHICKQERFSEFLTLIKMRQSSMSKVNTKAYAKKASQHILLQVTPIHKAENYTDMEYDITWKYLVLLCQYVFNVQPANRHTPGEKLQGTQL